MSDFENLKFKNFEFQDFVFQKNQNSGFTFSLEGAVKICVDFEKLEIRLKDFGENTASFIDTLEFVAFSSESDGFLWDINGHAYGDAVELIQALDKMYMQKLKSRPRLSLVPKLPDNSGP